MYETCLGQGKLVLFVPNAEYLASAMSKLTEYRPKDTYKYACCALFTVKLVGRDATGVVNPTIIGLKLSRSDYNRIVQYSAESDYFLQVRHNQSMGAPIP
jgi:hypothetical protein